MINFLQRFMNSCFGKNDTQERTRFLHSLQLIVDGEASQEDESFVMKKIQRCQFSQHQYKLETCLKEKLKSLNGSHDTPKDLEHVILDKLTSHTTSSPN